MSVTLAFVLSSKPLCVPNRKPGISLHCWQRPSLPVSILHGWLPWEHERPSSIALSWCQPAFLPVEGILTFILAYYRVKHPSQFYVIEKKSDKCSSYVYFDAINKKYWMKPNQCYSPVTFSEQLWQSHPSNLLGCSCTPSCESTWVFTRRAHCLPDNVRLHQLLYWEQRQYISDILSLPTLY